MSYFLYACHAHVCMLEVVEESQENKEIPGHHVAYTETTHQQLFQMVTDIQER